MADATLERLKEDTEELISLLAQQTDKSATNLKVYVEDHKKLIDEKNKKLWSKIVVIGAAVVLAVAVLSFEVWERHYDRLNSAAREIVALRGRIDTLQDRQDLIKQRQDQVLERLNEHLLRILEEHRARELADQLFRKEIEDLKGKKKP